VSPTFFRFFNTKFKTARAVLWKVPMVLAGNEVPEWSDNAAVVFEFPRKVQQAHEDMELGQKLEQELPAIIKKVMVGLWLRLGAEYSFVSDRLARLLGPCTKRAGDRVANKLDESVVRAVSLVGAQVSTRRPPHDGRESVDSKSFHHPWVGIHVHCIHPYHSPDGFCHLVILWFEALAIPAPVCIEQNHCWAWKEGPPLFCKTVLSDGHNAHGV
jgi:hypothetical protein